ncbi:hypothetical protein RJ640_013751 [Escallonia rubra]|uniref:Ty3 transposon capsid-like protein domain-containing protein n=1 Tax=Escallonia rubra TaxID=112253 RepID=A0AA88R3E3_9ASTE|nr:hypothetical protein RJ640_013751 [Escallonia rubra]
MPRSVKNNQLVEVEHPEVQEMMGTRLATQMHEWKLSLSLPQIVESLATRTTDRSIISSRILHHLLQDYKVPYASVHFDAQAEHWYAAYIKPIEIVDWDSFVRDLYARFSVLTGVSVLGEFNKLHQIGTVDDYFNRFEALRAQVVQEFDYLDESYFCMSFIGGLRPEIQSRVEQFEVGSLTKAIHIARREEVAIQNLLRGHKSLHIAVTTPNYTQTPYKPTFTNPGPSYKPATPTTTAKPATFPPMPFKPPALPYTNSNKKGLLPTPPRPPPRSNQLPTEEHQRRMSQGLCFSCCLRGKACEVPVGVGTASRCVACRACASCERELRSDRN